MVSILSYEILAWFVTQRKLINKALFVIAKEQSTCPTGDWLNEISLIYAMKAEMIMKNDDPDICLLTWEAILDVLLREKVGQCVKYIFLCKKRKPKQTKNMSGR